MAATTGTATLLRIHLWRAKWTVAAWALGVALLYVSQGIGVDSIYTTQAEFDQAAASMEGNAALVAMTGPPRALNTTGGQVMWQSAAFGAVLVGLMSMILVGRRTRGEEESGRDELLRAAPIGRLAPANAALLTALVANLVVGLAVAASLVGYGLAAADSIATGLGVTGVGWVFTGVALLCAQLTGSVRATYGLVGLALGVAYVLRAVGDVGNGVASWLSPIGWYQAMHPYSGLRWWPALLLLAAAGALVVAAYAVLQRRDYGSGVLSTRPGPARAGALLGTGSGLAWRLQRGPLIGWTAGLFLFGLAYGSMGNDVEDLIGDSATSREMFLQGGGDVTDAFFATAMLMLALIASAYAVSSTLRPRSEEDETHAEMLLATGLHRSRWLAGHVGVTVLGSVSVLAGTALGLGAGYALVTGSTDRLADYTLPMVQYLPAVLVLSAVGRLLYGVAPRLMPLAWVPLVFAFVVMLFGEIWSLPQWLRDLSPFEHLALAPVEEVAWSPVLVLAVLAVLLSVAGQVAFRRRDVH